MPTHSFRAALLLLSQDKDSLPWSSSRWQTLTGVFGVPWDTDENASDDVPAKNVSTWSVHVAKAVKAFAQVVWSLPVNEQDKFIMARAITDNNALGRSAWKNWIQKQLKNWKISVLVDQVLITRNASPTVVLSAMRLRQLPSAEDAQIYLAQIDLAIELFGDSDVFVEGTSYLKPIVGSFCRTLLTQTWNRYRKVNHRELERMDKGIAAIGQKWKFMTDNAQNATAQEIRSFLRELRGLLSLLSRYNDDDSKAMVAGYVSDLEAMLATLMKDASIGDPDKIPKTMQDALRSLASREDIEAITIRLKIALENVQMSSNMEPVELDLDDCVDIEWNEGVEELAKVSDVSLWAMLGFPEQKLPFFQEWTDPSATIDPWTIEGQAWLKSEDSERMPFNIRWHQLVGIYRMVERAFEGKPILLMDGVGLGKTIQVLGTIACLAFYRNYYDKHKKFPGSFADRSFPSPDGNITDLPHVIVCPVNLREQWHAEIKRFLAVATFDVLPYVGRFQTRTSWWEKLFQKSQQPKTNRIILATFSAIQDDASICYHQGNKSEMGRPSKSARFSRNAPCTLFGHEYTLLAVDEAHVARKHNVAHMAVRALRRQARVLIAMTATPVTTRPQDLYIMGQWMGIPGFDDFDEFSEMSRKINKASREDSKALRDAGAEGSILRGMLSGARNKDAPSLELPSLVHEIMQMMRGRYATHVIRRTIDSVDFNNEKLFGMKPYMEHVMKVRMYDWEMEKLREIAKVLIQENPMASVDTSKNFYIEFRRSILHPTSNPKMDIDFPIIDNIEAWETHPQKTVKLDVLGKIVKYHLEKDGRAPLTMDTDGQTVITNTAVMPDDSQYAECDRIVIFSAFPSSNKTILSILKLHGFSAAEMHGSMSTKQRQAALNSFRKSTRKHGDRILILSAVGLVGLNLACANIMIIVDTTWSAMDDEQLRGRIFRYPQQKQVHFYRLVALRTPDVFLNNISFGKGELHTAFINSHQEFQRLFDSELVDDDNASLISLPPDPEDVGASEGSNSKSKGPTTGTKRPRGKGKAALRDAEIPADDPVPQPSGRKKAGKQVKSTLKRPLSDSPKDTSQSKRSRKRAATEEEDDDSSLADATRAMRVDGNVKASQLQRTRKKTSTPCRANSPLPTTAVPDILLPAVSPGDIEMETTDPVDDDPILRDLNAPGGQYSPSTDDMNARAALYGNPIDGPPSPLTSMTSSPPPNDVEIPSPAACSPKSIQDPSDETDFVIGSSRGLLAATHGGVIGRGRDGTGGRGGVRRRHNTTKRMR